jgi:uncharacterized membrane protein YqjE
MVIMTIWALILLIGQYKFTAVGIIAVVLLVLAFLVIFEAFKSFRKTFADENKVLVKEE